MRFPVECPHSLCEHCGECHDVECDLVQKLCLILFLETFLQEKLQEKISEEEREVYRVLNSSLLSDDITLEDLEQFSFLYVKMFPRKPETSAYICFRERIIAYDKVVLGNK